MSAHRRMKTYMERHKVGSLFEDLMSKLVSEMPHDPVPFLIKLLQHKQCQVTPQSVMTVAQLRRSLGDLASSLEVEKVPVHRKPSSAVVKRSRPSAPPTPTHCQQKSVTLFCPEPKGPVDFERSGSKSRPTTPSKSRGHSAPKLRQELTVAPSSAPPPETPSRTLPFKATRSYPRHADINKLNMNKFPECYQATGYNGPILPGQVANQDPLKDELMVCVTREKAQDVTSNDQQNAHSFQQTRKQNNLRTISRSEKYIGDRDGGADGNCDTSVIEMYEDPEDLASEGIYLFPSTGFKIGSKIKTRNSSCQHWHFNVCSVCAKVFKYRESSEVPTCCLGICYPRSVVPVGRPTTVPLVEMITTENESSKNHNQMQLKLPGKSTKTYGESSTDANNAIPINTGHFTNEAQPSPSLLDTGRSLSTEDLFATPRSLPLPRSPSENKVKIEWCVPILDTIHDRACGWDVLSSQDSDVF